jgi:hypothetical protein
VARRGQRAAHLGINGLLFAVVFGVISLLARAGGEGSLKRRGQEVTTKGV